MMKYLKYSVLLLSVIFLGTVQALSSSDVTSNRLSFGDGKIPYFRNIAIGSLPGRSEITTAIIVIHGTNRNAGTYYRNMRDAVSMAGRSSSMVVIAPQFLIKDDVEDSYGNDSRLFYWSSSGWKIGYKAKNHNGYSSFEIVDFIINKLKDSQHIKDVVVIGHSAGGQFVNRYGALSRSSTSPFNVKYITANPSSYMYFDNQRLVNGSWRVPNTNADYNEYKYGTERLSSLSYVKNKYSFNESVYRNRKHIILLGKNDTQRSSSLDKSESADLQGRHRLERGRTYKKHLDRHFNGHNTTVKEVPGVGHSHSGIFKSSQGRSAIFNSGGSSGSSSSSSSGGGGGECNNTNDCKAVYNGKLKQGWTVHVCNKNKNVCRCKKGNNKQLCSKVKN